MEAEYYQCTSCEQTVQGWGAMQDIECCDNPHFVALAEDEQGDWVLPPEWATCTD